MCLGGLQGIQLADSLLHMISRLIFLALVSLIPFELALASPKVSAPNNGSEYVQMRLTHTIFQGVMARHFFDQDTSFDAPYFADRAYAATFLNKWSQMIESGSYSSSQAIFDELKNGQYLGRYSQKWRTFVEGPGIQNQFLKDVLNSERNFKDLDRRILYILKSTTTYLVVTDGEDQLAELIASAFLENANLEIREQAKSVSSNISLQKVLRPATWLFNIWALARGSLGALGLKSLIGAPRLGLNAMNSARLLGRGAARFGSVAINPLRARISLRHTAIATSVAGHVTLLGHGLLFSDEVQKNQNSNGAEDGKIYSNSLANVIGLWDIFLNAFGDSFLLPEWEDFSPNFSPWSKETLIARVRDRLNYEGDLDFGDAFLQAEKLSGIDQRDPSDLFAMQFINNRYERLRSQVKSLFKNEPITMEKLEDFRKLVIEDVLYKYKRDYPNLTSTFLDWGGNCVAQTMLMISLLEPYRQQLPRGHQLVILLKSDHIEAGLWDGFRLTTLIAGSRTNRVGGTLHRPEYLLVVLLRNYPGALNGLRVKTVIPRKGSKTQKAGENSEEDESSESKPKGSKDKRSGVLEMIAKQDRVADYEDRVGGDRGGQDDDVPYAADLAYSKIKDGETARGAHRGGGDNEDFDTDSDDSFLNRLLNRSDKDSHQTRSQSRQKKVPLFNYSINLNPSTAALFSTFEFNTFSKVVTAYDQGTYLEMLRKARQPKMTDAQFERFFREKAKEQSDGFFRLPIWKKMFTDVYAEPGISGLLKLNQEDFDLWNSAVREYASLVTSYARDSAFFGDPQEQLYTMLAIYPVSDIAASKKTVSKLDPKPDPNLKFNVSIRDQERHLADRVEEDPRAFLEVYDKANNNQRRHILQRIFGQDFSAYAQSKYGNSARNRVRNFIARLSQIQVDYSHEDNWICSLAKVDLPVVSSWPELMRFSDQSCNDKMIDTEKPEVKKTESEKMLRTQTMELKLSTLIEIVVLFGRGLHLWDQKVIDAFVDGHYDSIGVSRETTLLQVRAVLESEPALLADPRFEKIRQIPIPKALTVKKLHIRSPIEPAEYN